MKRLIMILFVLFIIGGCGFLKYPEELDLFTKKTDKAYWYFDVEKGSKTSLSLIQKRNQYIIAIDAMLSSKTIPKHYNKFKEKSWSVFIYDSKTKQLISWKKRKAIEEGFADPKLTDCTQGIVVPEYFTNDFDYTQNTIAIKKKWVKKLMKLSTITYLDWIGYLGEYNLSGAKGDIPLMEDRGKLLFFISPSHNRMIESYFSNNRWDYIRYVEGGEFPLDINKADPESMIKTIWDAWQEYILPYINYLNLEFAG